ncbi:hypothetical protein CEXT_217851 [Caerostris extrusa]|uniref:Uncharacterized protein n=1 Tax=Caerostris extrusa TaxID=172846 RepID=A0AAV4WPM6_CAEEX|nr:hypothetical protein CEXT_217851 [Caerostris extrusa]
MYEWPYVAVCGRALSFQIIAVLTTIDRLTLGQDLNKKRAFPIEKKKVALFLPLLCIILNFFGGGTFPLLALSFAFSLVVITSRFQLCPRNCPEHK